jgi:hypothetical protein
MGGALALAAAVLGWASAARAQEIPPPAVTLLGGVAQYDLSGTGSEPFGSVRLDLPMTRWLYAEPSFGWFA